MVPAIKMRSMAVIDTTATIALPQTVEPPDEALVSEDLLIEEISIDGMCGVY